jgi:predicted nuclease with RNAse H fold
VSVRVLGVDVGGDRKGLDLVVMDGGRAIVLTEARATLQDVASVLRDLRPQVVAIDSPPMWNPGASTRRTERHLAEIGISTFPTPSAAGGEKPFFEWMKAGMAVYALAAGLGYPLDTSGRRGRRAIEVFPYGSAVVLSGGLKPHGMRTRDWRERVLRAHGVATDALRTLDQVDAALAALTGLMVAEGRATFLGDGAEGVIVLPVSAPLPRYRPGPAPAEDDRRLFRYCACGCGRQVVPPREFVSGHDGRYKSMLWDRVREGRRAEEELERRRWERPPETR